MSLESNGYVIKNNFFEKEEIIKIREDSKGIFRTQFRHFNYVDDDLNFHNNMVK